VHRRKIGSGASHKFRLAQQRAAFVPGGGSANTLRLAWWPNSAADRSTVAPVDKAVIKTYLASEKLHVANPSSRLNEQ